MTNKKTFIITTSIVWGLLLVAFILGTIFDLQISQLFVDLPKGEYYSQNTFAIIGEIVGEQILYIFLICACAILFFNFIRNPLQKKWLNFLIILGVFALGILVGFYCFYKLSKYISIYSDFGLDKFREKTIGKLAIFAMSLIFTLLLFLCFKKVKKETLQQLSKWALWVLIISAISNGFVQGLKLFWGRTRFRAMNYMNDSEFSHFTNWFQINKDRFASVDEVAFLSDFYKSFPSGHSCAGASSFLLVLLPCFIKKTNTPGWKITFIIFASVYTFLVMLSRIVAGAHFFTDVFVGAFSTIICIFVAKWFFIEKRFKKQNANNEK